MRIIGTYGLVGLTWFQLACRVGSAATNYVALVGGHVWPYTNWVSAATNIQDAVDAASDGDWVLVSSGAYRSGGAVTPGYTLMNRVCITNAITLASVFGRDATVIVGAPDPLTGGLGSNAVRCAYMINHAVLSGFTLSNGHTLAEAESSQDEDRSGGGVFACAASIITNCMVTLNRGGQMGGGVYGASSFITDSIIETNQARFGGGYALKDRSELSLVMSRHNISLTSGAGGHVVNSDVVSSSLFNNYAGNAGGGLILMYASTIRHSTISQNVAGSMGALWVYSTGLVVSCRIISNECSGGALTFSNGDGTATNCTIDYNYARDFSGGGVYFNGAGVIADSTIEWNRASFWLGGGVSCNGGGKVIRCLVRNNAVVSANGTAQGGGAYLSGGLIDKSVIQDNQAGDGFLCAGAGGGVYVKNGGSIHNSIIDGNNVYNLDVSMPGCGGGVYVGDSGGLYNCLVTGNRAWGVGSSGGGVYSASADGLIVNCTVTGDNYARGSGGGTVGGTVQNTIVYGNNASGNDEYYGGAFAYSCAVPLPAGAGNIADDPQFAGGYQLAWGSPCINTGNNAYVVGAWDLAGTNRILFGTVDMGCYEFPVPEPAETSLAFIVVWTLYSVGGRHDA